MPATSLASQQIPALKSTPESSFPKSNQGHKTSRRKCTTAVHREAIAKQQKTSLVENPSKFNPI